MKFSICIPNYNYGNYIGETIDSVLNQDYDDFEIIIVDNKSTDNSWEVIQSYKNKDNRIKTYQNPTNLGFAGNLEKASSLASGEYQILLSSDDIINEGALSFYSKFIDKVKGNGNFIFGSSWTRIDSESKFLENEQKRSLWQESNLDNELTEALGKKVYKSSSDDLLRACFTTFRGPFNFATVCYNTNDYLEAGGYGGGKLFNPDKWLHWKVLGVVKNAYYIDFPFFCYRWHDSNQVSQQTTSGALKLLVDEYRSTFEISNEVLQKVNLSRENVQQNFIRRVILPETYRELIGNNAPQAKRILNLGLATYPSLIKKEKNYYLLKVLTSLGSLGAFLAKAVGKKG